MKLPQIYLIDYPSTAKIVLPMQHYSSLIEYDMSLGDDHDATPTTMAAINASVSPGKGRWVKSRPFGTGWEHDGGTSTSKWDLGFAVIHNVNAYQGFCWYFIGSNAGPGGAVEIFAGQRVSSSDSYTLYTLTDGSVGTELEIANDHETAKTAAGFADPGDLILMYWSWSTGAKLTLHVYNYTQDTESITEAPNAQNGPTNINHNAAIGGYTTTLGLSTGIMCRFFLQGGVNDYTTVIFDQLKEFTLGLDWNVFTWTSAVSYIEFRELIGTDAYNTRFRTDGAFGRTIFFENASNDRLEVSDHADLEIGANDFTIAFKAFSSDLSDDDSFIMFKNAALSLNVDASGDIEFIMIGVGTDTSTTTGTPFTEDIPHSVVVKRTSNVLTIWVDGVSETLDSATQNETMAANANDWLIGGDGSNTMERLELLIFDPSVAYSDQWCKDFHNGLPTIPVWEDPVSGPSRLGFSLIDPSGDYVSRFHNEDIYLTQVLCWMGEATKGLYPFFWRGHLQESQRTATPQAVTVQCVDHSIIHETSFDVTIGRDEGSTSLQDHYDTLDEVRQASITLDHTKDPIGIRRIYTASRGTPIARVFRDIYNDYLIPGYVDPWNDHWLRVKHSEPIDIDDWTDAAGDWTNDGDGVIDLFLFGGKNVIRWTAGAAHRDCDFYRTVSVSTVDFPYLSMVLSTASTTAFSGTPLEIRLRCGAGNFYSFIIDAALVSWEDVNLTLMLRLPSADSNFFWTETGTCDPTAIDRVWFYGIDCDSAICAFLFDEMNFFSVSDHTPSAVLDDTHLVNPHVMVSRQNAAKNAYVWYDSANELAILEHDTPGFGDAELLLSIPGTTDSAEAYTVAFSHLARHVCTCVPSGPFRIVFDNLYLWLRRGDPVHLSSVAADLSTQQVFIQNIRILPGEGRLEAVFNWRKQANLPVPPPPPELPALITPPLTAGAPIGFLGGLGVSRAVAAAQAAGIDLPEGQTPLEQIQALIAARWPGFQEQDEEENKYKRRFYT